MVKSSSLFALVSILARTFAQDDYDDCEDEETSTSAVSSSATGNCPQLPAPSTTDTVTLLTQVAATTTVTPITTSVYSSTFTSTVPQPTDQTGVTYFTVTVAGTTETVYYGSTFTSVAFDVVPASTTTTVPRPAGFTPVRCESAYVGPFETSTIGYTSTVETYSIVSTVTIDSITTEAVFPTGSLVFPTTVLLNSTSTISLRPTTTITSTRNDPTSTVYAACQGTDNVVADAPPSKYKYVGAAGPLAGTYSSIVAAIDQVDCCQLCFATDNCAASAWYVKPYLGISLDTYLVQAACQLFLKNDTTTCDQSSEGATMLYDYPELVNYYSNGPCGQYSFNYTNYGRFIYRP